jgi:aryl-alcohol dehydrogenase-like predicted oxidoreductase
VLRQYPRLARPAPRSAAHAGGLVTDELVHIAGPELPAAVTPRLDRGRFRQFERQLASAGSGPGGASPRLSRTSHGERATVRFRSLDVLAVAINPMAMARAIDAGLGGTFDIGGDLRVHRLGFGAMRITGAGIWGEPSDPAEARRVLRRVRELGIDFIDTADSYGPEVSERLIREELAPYTGLVIATKGGLVRPGPDEWVGKGDPKYLRECVEHSLSRLGVERIDLWQLHRIDAKVSRDEQFGVIADMQREGLIRHVGLSEVSVEDIEAAGRFFRVATVQNLYNLVNRQSEAVLEHCERHGIGFIPWYPLAAGNLAAPGGPLAGIARRLGAAPSQVALAWVLRRSPVMLPIPGTGSVKHLEENAAAAALQLSDEDFSVLDVRGKRPAGAEASRA